MSLRAENIRRALEASGASEEEIREEMEEQEAGMPSLADRARVAGIPSLYRAVTWAMVEVDDPRKEAIESARLWTTGGTSWRGLYLWSEGGDVGEAYGVGKTQIAAAAALQLLDDRRRRVRWLECSRLMTDLNLSYANPQHEKAAAKLARPEEGEAVFMDDLDKIPVTDRNVQPVYTLIHDCVVEQVPLVITANRSLDSLSRDFGERFGSALASRLVGHCMDVEVGGRDRRLDP